MSASIMRSYCPACGKVSSEVGSFISALMHDLGKDSVQGKYDLSFNLLSPNGPESFFSCLVRLADWVVHCVSKCAMEGK